ncbi:MAG: hypothetical protein CMN30_23580 [Sandaracinus sp.]|nr:hypothetical protein [Sandaracinus sp.]|tara:strand:- start:1618 stop:2316 length:699 start_codon:yes stop_codon:yes gene_type:complete
MEPVEDIEEALRREGALSGPVAAGVAAARANEWSIAAHLVDAELVEEDRLAELVAGAVGSMVVDLQQGELDPASVELLPEALARRHLMVPVAPDESGRRLRVAFADPLDRRAVRAVCEIAGLEIEPLVATVSDVRAAIRKVYGRDTHVMSRPEDLRPSEPPGALEGEATQRLDKRESGLPSSAPSVGTAPVHRLTDEATAEQRHEALLLALIDAGVVTRAEYIDALRRLLRR